MVAAQLAEAPTTFTSPWLTQKEAAAFAKKGLRTVNEALRAGTLRGYQSKPGGDGKRGGSWTVNVEDLDAWIRAGSPTAPLRRR